MPFHPISDNVRDVGLVVFKPVFARARRHLRLSAARFPQAELATRPEFGGNPTKGTFSFIVS